METLVDSVTGFPRKRHSSGGAIWLRTVLVGVLLALLVPALAMAETAVAEEPATAAPAATPAATEPTPAAPAAEQATPADTAAPADTTAPAGTNTPADTTPAPPPATGTRPASPPTLVELQPGTVVTTTPTATTPAAPAPLTPSAPATPEVVPPALPTAPDAPRAEAPKSIVSAATDQLTVALPTAQSAPVALGSGPDAAATAAAPAAGVKDRALRSGAAAAAAVAADSIPSAGFNNPISLERSAPSAAAPTPRAESPADFGAPATAPEDNPFQVHLEAQGGPAPVGSSLLAVLASYVLPGGGSLPIQSTLFLFVQLAVILAFALAPRPGSGERLVLWGLLRPQAGHRLAVRRPG